jgi:LysR family transcriptional regulator, regulator for genes of the gallate degradation pathway
MTHFPGKRLPRFSRLRAFDQVAATAAMNAAAASLHIGQPAITRAIQSLERDLQVRLLERSYHGSFLTNEGRIFAQRTRRFLNQLAAAIAAATGIGTESDAVARLARKVSQVHMRSLLAISAARSFRGAASMLGIAEPTLHRPARELERLLKTTLYRRTSDGLGLSAIGAELARRFALGAVEIETGVRELDAHRGAADVSAKVGVLALAPKRLLAAVARRMSEMHPNARLVVREGAYDDLVADLRGGSLDFIFGALRSPPPFDDLDEKSLFDDPYRVVCRRHHPLTRLRRPKPSDLKAYDWVFPTAALPRRGVLEAILAQWYLSPRIHIETNSLGTLIADLAMSDHVSVLPHHYVGAEDYSKALIALDMPLPQPQRRVGLTTRRDWLPTAFQSELLNQVRSLRPPRRDRRG